MDKQKKKKMITSLVIGGIFTIITFIALIFAIVLFVQMLINRDRYKGEYPHLYTVAVYSLITCGRINSIESYSPANVIKVDEDSYGRELFIFSATPIMHDRGSNGARSVLICQKHDETYSYWYDNENYILAPYYGYEEEKYNGVYEDKFKGITDEQIEELKVKNDWGKDIDESKLSCARTVRKPLWQKGRKAEKTKATRFYSSMFAESGYKFDWCCRVVRDKDGRSIYCINGTNYDLDYDSDIRNKYIIAVMSPEGEFYEDAWFVYDSPTDYAENLTRIKVATGWNMKAL